VNSALFVLQDKRGKFRGLFNLKHLNSYLENRIEKYKSKDILVELQKAPISAIGKERAETGLREEEERTFWKVQPPPKRKIDAEDRTRAGNIGDPATFGNFTRLI
jgi:hypothetical protein